jgi:hypothetical protein
MDVYLSLVFIPTIVRVLTQTEFVPTMVIVTVGLAIQ